MTDREAHIKMQYSIPSGLKPKDLIGIPWRVAFALQADGWWLRQDIIWSKPNPMPESVRDRCTKSHEYIFMFTKSARYYYDAEAIKEEPERLVKVGWKDKDLKKYSCDERLEKQGSYKDWRKYCPTGIVASRNRRSAWPVATQPFSEAHFATFPPDLITPCILAGCPEKICPVCGAPWERKIKKSGGTTGKSWHDHSDDMGKGQRKNENGMDTYRVESLGFFPTCSHDADAARGIVLDPFMGAGTTALVALKTGRQFIGIELKQEYIDMAIRRIAPLLEQGRLAF